MTKSNKYCVQVTRPQNVLHKSTVIIFNKIAKFFNILKVHCTYIVRYIWYMSPSGIETDTQTIRSCKYNLDSSR